jgi:hypothetical protein
MPDNHNNGSRQKQCARDDWISRARAVGFDNILTQRRITLKGHNGELAGPCPGGAMREGRHA